MFAVERRLALLGQLGEVPRFLKLRQCYQEEMAECWKLCEEESSSDSQVQARARAKDATPPATAASGQPSGDGQSAGSGQPATPGQPPSSGRGRKRLQAGPETPTPKSGKKNLPDKSELSKTLAEAGKTKGLYTSVVVRAENLVEQTDTMAPWAWART